VASVVALARAEHPGPDPRHPWMVDSDTYQLFYREPVIVVDHLPRSLVASREQMSLPGSIPYLQDELAKDAPHYFFVRAKTWQRLLEIPELRLDELFEPRFFRPGRSFWGDPKQLQSLSDVSRRESKSVIVVAHPRSPG
jgi:hypothetical protein